MRASLAGWHLRQLAGALRGRLSPAAPAAEPARILVLGYAAIGDLIFLLPALRELRARFPRARIVFLANDYATTRELVPASGVADEVWLFDWEGPDARSRQAEINARIAAAGFDWALLSLSSPAHFFQSGLSRIPIRAGHCRVLRAQCAGRGPSAWARRLRLGLVTGELARRLLLNRVAWIAPGSEHAARRNLRLLDALGLPLPAEPPRPVLLREADRAASARLLADLPPGVPRLAVHPGPARTQYFKTWPADRLGRLLASLTAGRRLEVLLLGDVGEEDSATPALAACPRARNLVGRLKLTETFAVIERCDLFLGNDTGLAKAAMALGVPTATIWGPTDPAEVGAVWEPEKHLEIRTGIPCSPCARLGMAKDGPGVLNYLSCGHHDCLGKLEEGLALGLLRSRYPSIFGAA